MTPEATPRNPRGQVPGTDFRPSIIYGEPAAEGEIPFQAALFSPLTSDPGNGKLCGGSLIRTNWVLTAAHCLVDTSSTDVGLGGTNRNSMPFQVTSNERFPHEQYNRQGLRNDVGLIKLPRDAVGQNIVVVPMAVSGSLEDLMVRASGFGVTENGMISNDLLKVNLRTITNQECLQTYSPNLVTENTLCATWVTREGESTCQGDSGGPLSTVIDGQDVLIGVSSFVSSTGCESGDPSGYSRTSAFQDWINQTINNN